MSNEPTARRTRGAKLGLLLVLLLALSMCGYRLTFSPSASTGTGRDKPSATPSADVLAPNAPSSTGTTGGGTTGTTATGIVLAPAAGNNGNGNGNGSGNGTGSCVDPSDGNGNCDHRFGVTVGASQTLYPGLVRALPVTFANPNKFDILVTTYRVSVSVPSAQALACPSSSLEVPSGTVTLNPRLTAPKSGSVATTVPIKLSANAPEGCQRVVFTITVDASAVKK